FNDLGSDSGLLVECGGHSGEALFSHGVQVSGVRYKVAGFPDPRHLKPNPWGIHKVTLPTPAISGYDEPVSPMPLGVSMAVNGLEFLPANDWKLLESKGRAVSFSKDEFIIRQGVLGKALYILRDGHVRIERSNNGSGPVRIATLNPGDVFGDMAFIEDAL